MIVLSAFADEIDQDLQTQIDVLRGEEIRHIEFRAAWGKNVLDLSDEEIAHAKAMMDEQLVRVSAVGSPIGKVKLDDDFDAHMTRFKRALWVAKRFETPYVRIFSFYGPDGKSPVDDGDEVVRRLTLFAKMAAEEGLVLCHENESHIYGDTPDRCVEIMERVGSPSFRCAFDPANFVQVGHRPFDECWPRLKEHVEYFHVKDALSETGKVCPAGEGDGQIEETLRDALADGFSGICSLEPHLKHAGQFSGQTGPDLFHVAAKAYKGVVERAGGRWRPVRGAVVGAGMIARFHLEAIGGTPEAFAVGVVDRSGRHQDAGHGVPVYRDIQTMLDDAKPDFITIATPSGAHLEPCQAAAARGVHVLTEKPVEVTPERVDRMIETCKQSKVNLGVVFQSRYVPQLARVKQLIDQERLGKIIVANAYTKWFRPQSYYDNGGWRGTWEADGGGALMNQSIHYVDLLLWLAGDVSWVCAQMGALRHEIETEDHVAATLRFANGAIGTLMGSTAMWPGFDRVVEVIGTKGSVIIRDDYVPFCRIEGEDVALEGIESDSPAETAASDPASGLRGRHVPVVASFVDAILNNRPPDLDGGEGRRSVELICAVYASAKNDAPVRLG